MFLDRCFRVIFYAVCNLARQLLSAQMSHPEDGLAAHPGAGIVVGHGNEFLDGFRLFAQRECEHAFFPEAFAGVISYILSQKLKALLASLRAQPERHVLAQRCRLSWL